jgi:predicted component of type VI protein secretion system
VVSARGRLSETGLNHALADRWRNVPGGQGWSVLAGLYDFGPGETDVGLLAALGIIASQAGGPFIARGNESLATAPGNGWPALRASEAAPWIGLAAPRVLLRLPYGKGTDPIAAFSFEEMPGMPVHEAFLWGNPALAVALLVGRAFSERGWDFEPGDEREIRDLPAFTYVQDGERELQACAESHLGEQGGNALLAAGLMPVLSHRHANAVTLMRLQSVAQPPLPLRGLAAV